ncbi:hypothetical protein [Accumulibacter sp.]|uniref:hypothetical protein n=1 Tax=Accumulibacter sp. TaxID=2053492 RepID=UPI0025F3C41C|nr:hypothetical protein [Accumulibacter sp.]
MPVTAVCGIIGALAISSFPWTSGFVSKSMISQAAGDEHLQYVWLGLAAASAGSSCTRASSSPGSSSSRRIADYAPPIRQQACRSR